MAFDSTLFEPSALKARVAGSGDIHARAVARLEDTLLEAALSHTGGRRAEAAAALGIGRNTLSRKLAGREPRE